MIENHAYYFRKGKRKMKTKKTSFDYMKKIRNEWTINPRTRIKENELKNKKKRRQEEKKMIKEVMFL